MHDLSTTQKTQEDTPLEFVQDVPLQEQATQQKVEVLRDKIRVLRMVETQEHEKSTQYQNEETIQNTTLEKTQDSPQHHIPSPISGFTLKERAAGWIAALISCFWIGYTILYAASHPEILTGQIEEMAGAIAAVFLPPTLIWMTWAAFIRKAEGRIQAAQLRAELRALLLHCDTSLVGKEMDALTIQAARLAATSRSITQSLARARQGLRTELRDFAGVSQKAEFHIGRLAETLAAHTEAAKVSGGDLAAYVAIIQQRAESALESTKSALIAAQEAAQGFKGLDVRLSEHATSIITGADAAARAGQTLSAQEDILKVGAMLLIERTEAIEAASAALHAKTNMLAQNAQQIENTGHAATDLLTETIASAARGAIAIEDAARRATIQMDNAVQNIQERTETMQNKITESTQSLLASGPEAAKKLENIVTILDNSRTQLEITAKDAETKNTDLNNEIKLVLKSLVERSESFDYAKEQLKKAIYEPLKDLEAATHMLDSRAQAMSLTLEQRAESLVNSAEKVHMTAQNVKTELSMSVTEIGGVFGKIKAHAAIASQEIAEQSKNLSSIATSSIDGLRSVGIEMAEQKNALSCLTQSIVSDMSIPRENMESYLNTLRQKSDEALTQMESVRINLDTSANNLIANVDKSLEHLNNARSQIENAAERISPVCDAAAIKAHDLQKQMTHLCEAHEIGTVAIKHTIEAATQVFAAQLCALEEGSTRARASLEGAKAAVIESNTALNDMTENAITNASRIATTLEAQETRTHITTDRVLGRLEGVREAMVDHLQDFEAGTQGALVRLHNATDVFAQQAQNITREAAIGAAALEAAGERAQAQAQSLIQAVNIVGQEGKAITQTLEQARITLTRGAQNDSAALERTVQSFALKAQELTAHLHAAQEASLQHGQNLTAQVATLARTSSESTDRMARACEDLTTRMREIEGAAHQGSDKLTQTCTLLHHHTQGLSGICDNTLKDAERAAAQFMEQAKTLAAASAETQKVIQDVSQAGARLKKGEFLAQATFIIESLHSLSLDITRIADGGIDEGTWRAFQRGDMTVFSRRLAQVEGALSIPKAQRKFAEDGEFRSYVLRFLHQFEELWSTAQKADHNALLASTFGGSDIGRLYHLLSRVANRESHLLSLSDKTGNV